MRTLFVASFLLVSCIILSGCTPKNNQTTMVEELAEEVPVLTGSWQIEDINQQGVMDFSVITMQFSEQNRITGSTGCNRYMADVQTENQSFIVSKAAVTKRACIPAIGEQEHRFLVALEEAARYEIQADTWLIIYDGADQPRLKMILQEPQN